MKQIFFTKTTSILLLFSALFNAGCQDTSQVSSTFVGSHGYLLESKTKKVAIDAHIYWQGDPWGYIKPPINVKKKIENAEVPFNNLDLILVSHAHEDHFNASMIEKSMGLNENAVLVVTPEVYAEIQSSAPQIATYSDRIWVPVLEFYHSKDTTINGIPLTLTNIEHGQEKMSLYVYSFVVDDIRFVQLNGWNSITGEMYDTLGFNRQRADVAFLGYDYILNGSKYNLFKNRIKPKYSIITHIDGANSVRYNSIQSKIDEYKSDFPMSLQYTPMDGLTIKKINEELIVDTIVRVPMLLTPLKDTTIRVNSTLKFAIPANSFIDNYSDIASYSATLSNGDNLPGWLNFIESAVTFFGTPTNTEVLDIKVTATNLRGGSISDVFTLTISEMSTIQNVEAQNEYLIYPNPAREVIQVHSNATPAESTTYQLININGQVVQQGVLATNTIEVSELDNGLYILKLWSETGICKERILVN